MEAIVKTFSVGIDRILVCAALTLAIQSTTPAQQQSAVQNWLMASCQVGEGNQVQTILAQLGAQAVPELISAAQNGPDPATITQRQTSVSAAYDVVQQALTAEGPDGLDPSDIALAQAQSREVFVAQDIDAFVLNYRIRGLQGLGIVGGSDAIQVLRQLANDSSSPDIQVVANEVLATVLSPTLTTLSSSKNPTLLGELVTFTATVTSTTNTFLSGTVTFMDGAVTLGSVSLTTSGHATFTTSSLIVGAHSIVAVYGGDFALAASSSAPFSETVVRLTLGDVNTDGVVNCVDLGIVKASFGKKTGQPGFDPRADVNGDGVVNVLDLSAVARQLLAGTVCH